MSASIWAGCSVLPNVGGITLAGKPFSMYALGLTIEVRMNAWLLPLSTLSRSGPIVPVAPASLSVWQDEQLVVDDVKIVLPLVVTPPPPDDGWPPAVLLAPVPTPLMNLSNAGLDSTIASARMTAWPRPHSSAQTTG